MIAAAGSTLLQLWNYLDRLNIARFKLTLSRDTARPQTDGIGGILGGKVERDSFIAGILGMAYYAVCSLSCKPGSDGLLHRCAIVLLLHEVWEWEGEAAAAAAAEAAAEDRALRGIWAVGLLCRWQPQECSRKLTISCTPLH
uniref:Uncharacterized protein n=1 Tax=Oryza meridionalis TaxID=40149 RepID=A0A0E0BYI6_9ORYZ